MTDELFRKYMQRGGGETLGDPDPDLPAEQVVKDKQGLEGRCRHFARGSIYWTQKTDAWIVEDKILAHWKDMGAQKSELGYPISDQKDGRHGVYNRFQRGIIYYLPEKDVCKVRIGGRDPQGVWRWVAIAAAIIFFLAIAVYFNLASCIAKNSACDAWNAGVIPTGIALLGPLAGLIIRFAWPSSDAADEV